MKLLGAILAILGIVAVALGALHHFNPDILASVPNATLFLVGGGVAALLVGALLARVNGDSDA